jgi:hypothetical protein
MTFLFSLLSPNPFLFPKSRSIYSKASMCVYMCAMHIYTLGGSLLGSRVGGVLYKGRHLYKVF